MPSSPSPVDQPHCASRFLSARDVAMVPSRRANKAGDLMDRKLLKDMRGYVTVNDSTSHIRVP